MAAGLIFLVDKPLPAKGPQLGFKATFINSKHKAYKKIIEGNIPKTIANAGDIILEIVNNKEINWVKLLNNLGGSGFRTQVIPLLTKDSKLKSTVEKIEGCPIHPVPLDAFTTLGQWYYNYLAGLLRVRVKNV
jgi:hypothetical protein|tara:strand:- start:409 stop:807 length:399 start_codon:yes stop_codon:yes gene_type:complete